MECGGGTVSLRPALHSSLIHNWRIDNPFVGPSKMAVCVTKGRNFRYMIMYSVILANKQTEYFVYRLFCVIIVWHKALARICRSSRLHFNCSVNTSILNDNKECVQYFPQVCDSSRSRGVHEVSLNELFFMDTRFIMDRLEIRKMVNLKSNIFINKKIT